MRKEAHGRKKNDHGDTIAKKGACYGANHRSEIATLWQIQGFPVSTGGPFLFCVFYGKRERERGEHDDAEHEKEIVVVDY